MNMAKAGLTEENKNRYSTVFREYFFDEIRNK